MTDSKPLRMMTTPEMIPPYYSLLALRGFLRAPGALSEKGVAEARRMVEDAITRLEAACTATAETGNPGRADGENDGDQG